MTFSVTFIHYQNRWLTPLYIVARLPMIDSILPKCNQLSWLEISDGNHGIILPFLRKSLEKICLSIIIFACPRLFQI